MGIGSRIEFIRGDLSRQDFGKRIGVGKTTVQNYENKDHVPKGHIIKKIRDEFGVNIEWLLTGDGDPYLNSMSTGGSPEVSEGKGLFGRTSFHDVNGKTFAVTQHVPPGKEYDKQPGGLGQAVEQLAQILTSDNELIVRAILFNLQAFYDTVINQKRDKERIKKLEEESEALKKRITILEEKLDRQTEEMSEFRKAAAGGES